MKSKPRIYAAFAALIFALVISVLACEENTYQHGKVYYQNFCANCHMDDGSGLEGVIPPLAGADYLQNNVELIPCIIRKGMKGEIVVNGKVYNAEMAGVPQLTEFEITNLINYMNSAWGNDYGVVKHEMVRNALKNCK